MTISAFDLFKVGIGPSSSHTVGPMRAASSFASRLRDEGLLGRVAGVRCELFGSLGATGHGHGSVKAVVLGLEGERPDQVDPAAAEPRVESIRREGKLALAGEHPIAFSADDDVVLHRRKRLEFHSNGMLFRALDADGNEAEPARVLLGRRRVRPRRGRRRQPGHRRGPHAGALPVPHR